MAISGCPEAAASEATPAAWAPIKVINIGKKKY